MNKSYSDQATARKNHSTRRNEILRRVDPARVSADCPGFVAGIAWRHDVLSMFCPDPELPTVSRRASTFFSSSLGARAGNRQFQMRLRYRLRYRSHCLSTLRPGLLQCRVRTFGQARRDALARARRVAAVHLATPSRPTIVGQPSLTHSQRKSHSEHEAFSPRSFFLRRWRASVSRCSQPDDGAAVLDG